MTQRIPYRTPESQTLAENYHIECSHKQMIWVFSFTDEDGVDWLMAFTAEDDIEYLATGETE